MLQASTVPAYLLGRGMLAPEELLEPEVFLVEHQRRNSSFELHRPGTGGYFVKQPASPLASPSPALGREHRILVQLSRDQRVASHVPRPVAHDVRRDVLVTELVRGSTVSDRQLRTGVFPEDHAHALAGVLRAIHAVRPEAPGTDACEVPLALQLLQHTPDADDPGAPALRAVATSPALQQLVRDVLARWPRSTLIHGDLRWDNVILADDGRQVLVDWELWALGDPAWDVACVAAQSLQWWAASAGPSGQPADSTFPLARVLPSMFRFVDTYAAERSEGFVVRVAQLTALRLVQAAYELLSGRASGANIDLVLRVADALAARPRDGWRRLRAGQRP